MLVLYVGALAYEAKYIKCRVKWNKIKCKVGIEDEEEQLFPSNGPCKH